MLCSMRDFAKGGERLTTVPVTGFPDVEESLMIWGKVQPMVTIAKIDYSTIFYVGCFLRGRRGKGMS